MHILFEYFDNIGMIEKNLSKILKWDNHRLNTLIEEIKELHIDSKPESESFFRFVGNEQFSAGRIPCSQLACRLKQATDTGIFSILYSDVTFIQNPFSIYSFGKEWNTRKKQSLIEDLIIIFYLKPLINYGVIQFCNGELMLCTECRKNLINQFLEENQILEKSIFNNSKFIIEKKEGLKPYLHIKSNDDVFGHNDYLIIGKTKTLESLLKKNAKSHNLTRDEMFKIKILKEIIEERIIDIILQNRNAEYYNSNYINSSNFSKNIISVLNPPEYNDRNNQIYDNFTHSVPAILNADFEGLIKFRENEFEPFLVYRDELKSLIKQKGNEINNNWDELFQDIIQPEINKMNLVVKNSKSVFKKKGTADIVIGAGLISFGLFSGLVRNDSTELLNVFGACEFIKGVIENLSAARSSPLDIKNNKFYFIWKLQTRK